MVLAILSLGFGLVAGGAVKDGFPDTPANHWAYEGVSLFKGLGFFVDVPGLHTHPAYITERSRYELATSYNAIGCQLHEKEERALVDANLVATSHQTSLTSEQIDAKEKWFSSPLLSKGVADLERAVKDFKREFTSLGADTGFYVVEAEQFKTRFAHFQFPKPGSALEPFSDVPTNHWAYEATKNLRAAGILHGYPDGTFNGG